MVNLLFPAVISEISITSDSGKVCMCTYTHTQDVIHVFRVSRSRKLVGRAPPGPINYGPSTPDRNDWTCGDRGHFRNFPFISSSPV